MKLETAIKVLQKESHFLGMDFNELLADIDKHGKTIYSTKVLEAADVFQTQHRH